MHLTLNYESLQDIFLPPILKLCERTNRILSDRAKTCLLGLCKHPVPLKTVLSRLIECRNSQSKSLRLCVIEALTIAISNASMDSLVEFEEQLCKTIISGLQDASEPVRAASRHLFVSFKSLFTSGADKIVSILPPSTIKALNILQKSAPASVRTIGSIKSFLATKNSEAARSGPQRVVSRPTPPTEVPSKQLSVQKPLSAIRVTKSSHHLGAPPPSQHQPKITSSHSVGSLPSIIHPPSPKSLSSSSSSQPAIPHSTIPVVSRPSSSSHTVSASSVQPPSYRQIVADFRAKLRQCVAWDTRSNAIAEFISVFSQKEFASEIVNSKASKLELFDIFLAGLLDVHHRVVLSVLAYGRALLKVIPSEKHPDPQTFTTFALIRLFKVVFDIQFRGRPQLLEEAKQFIDFLQSWLCSPLVYFECLLNAITRQDRALGFKMRKEAYEKFKAFLETASELTIDEKLALNGVKRLCMLLCDNADEGIKGVVVAAIESLALKAGLLSWLNIIPIEYKEIIEEHLLLKNPPITSPVVVEIQMAESTPSKHTNSNNTMEVDHHHQSLEMQSEEIILDAELGITMKVRSRQPTIDPMPITPIASRIKVDFDTPRSMEHCPAIDSDDCDDQHDNGNGHGDAQDNECEKNDVPGNDEVGNGSLRSLLPMEIENDTPITALKVELLELY